MQPITNPYFADYATAARQRRMQQTARMVLGMVAGMALLGSVALVPWRADETASTALASFLRNSAAYTEALDVASTTATVAPPTTHQSATAPTPTLAQQAISAAAPVEETVTIALRAGETIDSMLRRLGMVAEETRAAMNAVQTEFDLRRLKAGQEFTVKMRRTGQERTLLGLSFFTSPTKQIVTERQTADKPAFDADAVTVPTTLQRLARSGTISGSLFESAADAGVPRDVVRDLTKIFAHTIDFQRDLHAGDKFNILFEQNVTARGDAVGDGQIIFASVEAGGKVNQLYRYEYAKGQFDFFDESGKSARRGLLRTPVDSPRVTSGFGMRQHPILGYSRMHTGVDFGAPYGAPIYAAGDGVVEQVGWFGAYGRYVRIRHNNQLKTAYAHISRFAEGLRVGDRVRQGQVIAFVGSTGRSTGPHLHYEVHVNGRQVNPMSVNVQSGRSLSGDQLQSFKRWRDRLQAEFAAGLQGLPAGTKVSTAR